MWRDRRGFPFKGQDGLQIPATIFVLRVRGEGRGAALSLVAGFLARLLFLYVIFTAICGLFKGFFFLIMFSLLLPFFSFLKMLATLSVSLLPK